MSPPKRRGRRLLFFLGVSTLLVPIQLLRSAKSTVTSNPAPPPVEARRSEQSKPVARTAPRESARVVTVSNGEAVDRSPKVLDEEQLRAFLERASVQLNEAEIQILRHYSPDRLDEAVRDAEEAYRFSTEAERAERQREYDLAFNLASKLTADPAVQMQEPVRQAYRDYEAAVAREAERLDQLPAAARDAEIARIKESILGPVERKFGTGG